MGIKAVVELKKAAGRATETYTAYGVTENLYKECALQATYEIPQATKVDEETPKTANGEDLGVGEGWWHTGIFLWVLEMIRFANLTNFIELGLKPTFSSWSQVTMLHMYLLSARFRCFPAHSSQPWQQHLLDHFFHDAENRMVISHNMHARGTRNKYLKDLFIQWRGLLAAYDEGLAKGDAVLAAAVWRNIFKANEDVDVKYLAQIVSYMRRALRGLDAASDEDIMMGVIQFSDPRNEATVVGLRSKIMDTMAPEKEIRKT